MLLETPTLPESDLERVRSCEEAIGHRFRDAQLLLQALTHSSIKTEDNPSNERLEFLGDSVLGLVMTEFLYNFFQDQDEGDLTQIKSVVVSTSTLAMESERLNLAQFYNVGKGVSRRRKLPESLLANVFEAVVAAIYRDAGLEEARRFILRNLYHQVLSVAGNRHRLNFKSLLQQYAQKELNITPTYRLISEKGPDHLKWFKVVSVIADREYATGEGRSKKDAEQIAARESLRMFLRERGQESELGELSANGSEELSS
ncbi:MAG: ribonuclease III [Planctomycetes bacterium]|nr:ribonuclease III [Planctomycetota bacterium]